MTDLFEFPCVFPIKVMGEKTADLKNIVLTILKAHLEKTYISEIIIEERESSGGKYLSVTAKFTASSKEQLDNIYKAISNHEAVKFAL